jgi:hypothetical protein
VTVADEDLGARFALRDFFLGNAESLSDLYAGVFKFSMCQAVEDQFHKIPMPNEARAASMTACEHVTEAPGTSRAGTAGTCA